MLRFRLRLSRREFLASKELARSFIKERISHFNQTYKFAVKRISIRNQRTRWGSCSKKGNLNFNYRIALLPPRVADYIIVHELCHLQEFNHSKKFWNLVAKTIPDYATIREHLHLGIHKGTAVNILGYVQKQSDLNQWLNPTDYL